MRVAAQRLYDLAKDAYANETGQDIIETSIKAAAAAGTMEALTDMSPEEILLASIIGASGAMAARPLGKRLGRRVGRVLDAGDNDQSLQKMQDFLKKGMASDNKAIGELSDVVNRRFVQSYSRPDGTLTGYYEGVIGELARESADDLTQIGLGFALPGLFNRIPDEEEKVKQ